jgi:hypothetical protein
MLISIICVENLPPAGLHQQDFCRFQIRIRGRNYLRQFSPLPAVPIAPTPVFKKICFNPQRQWLIAIVAISDMNTFTSHLIPVAHRSFGIG